MQVPQGKATVPQSPAHLRCTHLPLKCPQGDRPQDEARQSGASTDEDRVASTSWGLLASAASPPRSNTARVLLHHQDPAAECPSQGQAPSGTHTHTVIVLQFHFVQVQYVYVHVLRIHCGGCDRTVLYTALFCVVWVPPLPYLTPWFHPWLHDLDSH